MSIGLSKKERKYEKEFKKTYDFINGIIIPITSDEQKKIENMAFQERLTEVIVFDLNGIEKIEEYREMRRKELGEELYNKIRTIQTQIFRTSKMSENYFNALQRKINKEKREPRKNKRFRNKRMLLSLKITHEPTTIELPEFLI